MMNIDKDMTNSPFRLVHKPDHEAYPGYWIFMDNRAIGPNEIEESLILFMGLSEEAAESIYNSLNRFLLNYLIDVGFFELAKEAK